MSIPHHESRFAVLAPSRPLGRHETAARGLTSLLILGASLPYLMAALKGGAAVWEPPPDMVSTLGEGRIQVAEAQVTAASDVLTHSVAIALMTLAGGLLLWTGLAGLPARDGRRVWRSRQSPAVFGGITGLAGIALGSHTAPATGSSWPGHGLAAATLLLFLVLAGALLFPGDAEDGAEEPQDEDPAP